jgi:carboxypeptidase Taq
MPNQDGEMTRFKQILAEVSDLNNAAALLDWDQQTYMPPRGAIARGHQLATLERLAHLRFTSDEMGSLLEDLKRKAADLDPDSDDARLIRVTARRFDKQVKVPGDLVAEFARVTAIAQQTWQQAKAEDNFSLFQPHLEKVVELRRAYADLFAPYDHIYDALLDDFEPGLKTADVQKIFTDLRPQQVELIKAIGEKPAIDSSFLLQYYDEQKQWDFSKQVATRFGYDWQRGRLDKSAHPFTTNFGIDDVRITTRVLPENLSSTLFGTMHETGHALYEMGVDPALERTPLARGASLAVHESQSRMWENLVGRSYPFWIYFYPRLQDAFPTQLGGVSLDAFYKAINKVEPSLIRVEADEATYNLHIMLRLELEIELIEGAVAVKDLPEAWNARMQDYLGIKPASDAQGVLQDIHWSGGSIGYFSTYALGNLISVQLWERIQLDLPTLEDQIRKGEFSELLGWLREHIHRYGAKYEPQELVQRITGSKIDAAPYVRYLWDKYGKIYDL